MSDESPQSPRVRGSDRARDTGPALESHLRFLLWLIPTVERFPRSQKFLLGDRIQASALDVLERLIEATYTKRRGEPLAGANLGIEKLRFLCRLAHDLRYLDHRRYEHAARSLDETGRLVAVGKRYIVPAKARDLFDEIASFPALLEAARTAAKGKRAKPGVAAFLANLEPEILRLERALRPGATVRGGTRPSRFAIPNTASFQRRRFRDRVVHHAFCTVVEPVFERGFIYDSYANRVGKGTHRAIARYERFRDRHRWVLRCDIYRYFPAIDHEILKADLRRRIACACTLALADRLIDGSNPQEPVQLYYPGDDLFMPFERRRGLPIGNLTSQFFANVYLNGLDHFCKEVLRAKGYLRYVDDFALFHDDREQLEDWRQRIVSYLDAGACACTPARPRYWTLASRPRFWVWSCCRAVTGVCRRTTCAVSAIACAGCTTAGARARSHVRRSFNASAVGLRTRNMRIHGACAKPSFGRCDFAPSASLTVPASRPARGFLEQQSGEPPFGQPQQEHHRQSQHQQRVPCGPHVRTPEPGAPRGDRASDRASRGGHDEPASPNRAAAPRPAPVLALWATGAGRALFDPTLTTMYRCVLEMAGRTRAPG